MCLITRHMAAIVLAVVWFSAQGQEEQLRKDQVMARLSLPSSDSLSLLTLKRGPLGITHLKYQQYHQGTPVLGGEVLAHFRAGQLVSLQDHAARNVRLAEDYATMARTTGDAERFLVRPQGEVHYHLTSCLPTHHSWDFVDLASRRIILSVPMRRGMNATGRAITRFHGEVEITTTPSEGRFLLQEEREGVLIRTLDAGNLTIEEFTENFNQAPLLDTVPGFYDDDNFWDLRNDRMDEIATDIHWATEVTFDYFKEIHGRNSIDDEGGAINNVVHLGNDWDEAFYLVPPFNFMGYGDGGPIGPNATLDVVAHEVTHAVVFYAARLLYIGESSCLDEGFADIFGTTVKFYQPVAALTNPWVLAEQLGSYRNLQNPKSLGQPDTYQGENWYTGNNRTLFAHQNNGPINFWFYLLSSGGSGINDRGQAYDLTGIGIGPAEQIAYRTLNYYLHSTAQFSDARVGAIQAATDLFGENSDEVSAVMEAWDAVGVGDAIVTSLEPLTSDLQAEIFPNPVASGASLHLRFPRPVSAFHEGRWKLYSLVGAEIDLHSRIRTVHANELVLDLQEIPPGTYILRLSSSENASIKIQIL